MCVGYGLTLPLGQAIGLILLYSGGSYDPDDPSSLLLVGCMNAISAGLLLWSALVQLIAGMSLSRLSSRKEFRAVLTKITHPVSPRAQLIFSDQQESMESWAVGQRGDGLHGSLWLLAQQLWASLPIGRR